MNGAERTELAKLTRLNARIAKSDVDTMIARRLADVESQLAARYARNHSAWTEITQEAAKAVAGADAQIAELCRVMGVSEAFRPRLLIGWHDRGENADKNRRAELRKAAEAELAYQAKRAKGVIDRHEANQLTQLASGALTSEDARAFLKSMPSIDELVPVISLPALENTLGRLREGTAP